VQSSWYLEPYQRVPGQVDSFLEHIRGGVLEAAADPHALLLFSGGETRASAGPISEAASYWMVAQGQQWFGACLSDRQLVYTCVPQSWVLWGGGREAVRADEGQRWRCRVAVCVCLCV